MKKRVFALLLALMLLPGVFRPAAAQSNYSFQLTQEVVHVYLNQDGTMELDYLLTFKNDPGAHVIEFVDLGLPSSNYSMGSISADVGGKPVNVTSDYQGSGSGVALDLGKNFIRQVGTVHAHVGRITSIVYPDDNDNKYASFEFSPTYFGSQYVHGNTDLTVTFHLPPGVKPEEPRYHPARSGWPGDTTPAAGLDENGRITYTWQSQEANGSTGYIFGASFPKQYIPDSAIVTVSFLDVIVGFLGGMAGFLPFCCIGGLFVGVPILSVIGDRKRRMQYIKPTIAIEGHGIKRGLTAVEAAILMGQPLEKVMTMILFSSVKKGALQVVTRDPLKVEMITPQPEDLQDYEKAFVGAMVKDERPRRVDLQDMTVRLVKSVTEKMKGFSRKETIDYYQSINEKAWEQIKAAGTPEVQSQMFEQALEWTMLDKNYDDRARRTFTGPIFLPMWWGHYDPVYRGSSLSQTTQTSMPSMPSGSSGHVSLPGADFAASVVGGVQNFSGKVLGNVNDFARSVTNVTNPVPPPPARTGGYSGGGRSGGCACACACAGCACACAGGGR